MTFSCLHKLLEKCMLIFYQKKGSNSGFLEGNNDTWYDTPPIYTIEQKFCL